MPEPVADNTTFELALAELERIVHELEEGQVGLEESLARYEKGITLLKRCYGQLRSAEQKIMLLTGVNAEDKPLSKPFEHNAAVEKLEAPPPAKAPPLPRQPQAENNGASNAPESNRRPKADNPPSLF
jgi:exodeoxyribonuclease VII small subunit